MSLPERLKMVRDSLQLSQKEMGKSASISLQMWQAYEAGKSVPGGTVLEALARMGFNVNWILTGAGNIRQSESEQVDLVYIDAKEKLRNWLKENAGTPEKIAEISTIISNATGFKIDLFSIKGFIDDKHELTREELYHLLLASPLASIESYKNVLSGANSSIAQRDHIEFITTYDFYDDDTVNDLIRTIITDKVLKNDVSISPDKIVTISMTVVRVYEKRFCANKEYRMSVLEQVIDNMVRLALPEKKK